MLTQSASRTSEEAVTSARAEAEALLDGAHARAEALRASAQTDYDAAMQRYAAHEAERDAAFAAGVEKMDAHFAERDEQEKAARAACSRRPHRERRSSARTPRSRPSAPWAPPPSTSRRQPPTPLRWWSRPRADAQERVDRAHTEAGEIMTQAEDHLKWGQDTVRRILDEGDAEVARMRKETHRELAARMRSRRQLIQTALAQTAHRARSDRESARLESESLRAQAEAVMAAAQSAGRADHSGRRRGGRAGARIRGRDRACR